LARKVVGSMLVLRLVYKKTNLMFLGGLLMFWIGLFLRERKSVSFVEGVLYGGLI